MDQQAERAVVAGAPARAALVAARMVASGLDEREPLRGLAAMLAEVAAALDAPVAHLTRRGGGGVVLVATHGIDDDHALVEGAEPLPASGAPADVLDGAGPLLVVDGPSWGVVTGLHRGAGPGAYVPVPAARGGTSVCLGVEDVGADGLDGDGLALLQALGEVLGSVLAGLDRLADAHDVANRERARRRSSEAGAQVVSAGLGEQELRAAVHAMLRAARSALAWPAAALLRWTGAGWVVVAGEGHDVEVDDRRLPHRGVLVEMWDNQRTQAGAATEDDHLVGAATGSRLASPVRIRGEVRYALLVESSAPDGVDGSWAGDAVGVATRMALVLARLELLVAERDAAARLSEVDRMRANLLAVAGHELRTPLTVVLGYAQTLKEQAEHLSTEQLQRAADRLVDRAGYLSDLVDRVLLAARLESQEVELVPREVHLGTLLGAASWVDRVAVGDGLEDAVVLADPDWLARAVGYLVEHSTTAARSVVTLDARTVGDRAALMVRDDGDGIPGYERERVFRPFDGDGVAGSQVGLGPGLARGLVRAMGGELRLYSAVGYGSTFVVVLPAA